jgi:YfiH family protein
VSIRKDIRAKASRSATSQKTSGKAAKRAGERSAIKVRRALRDRERRVRRPKQSELQVLRAEKLSSVPWLLHGFSTRMGGVSQEYGGNQLNLGITDEDTRENVMANRERFLRAVAAVDAKRKPWPVNTVNQRHTGIIHRVATGKAFGTMQKGGKSIVGDGLITNVRGVLLSVRVADCYPVLLVDVKRKAIGIFHAGWRGTTQRIVQKGVGDMRRCFGSRPQDIVAVIGPGIGSCCYEIGEEVENEFDSQFAYSKDLFSDVFDSWSLHTRYPLLFLNQRAPGHGEPALSRHLDLAEANRRQLLDAGVPAENIEVMGLCTACHTDRFFSYRKERVTGRMMAVIGIRP